MSDKPRHPTQKAAKECAEAMVKLLKIGWPKESLDQLEALWWQVHDDKGNVKEPTNG